MRISHSLQEAIVLTTDLHQQLSFLLDIRTFSK